jgi:hypothetical protein
MWLWLPIVATLLCRGQVAAVMSTTNGSRRNRQAPPRGAAGGRREGRGFDRRAPVLRALELQSHWYSRRRNAQIPGLLPHIPVRLAMWTDHDREFQRGWTDAATLA